MTYNPLKDLDALVDVAIETQTVDMTETGTGGFERIVLPEGEYNLHFVEYIETGKRESIYNGKPTGKAPALNVRLGFLIYGNNGEVVRHRTFGLSISNNEKAKFKIFFDRINRKGDIKHAAQKLGQPFRAEITKDKKGDAEYNGINWGSLRQLPKFDPETGEEIKIPALNHEDLKLFLWNNPTKETWDSLYIEGKNDEGKSKNYLQEDILKAVDYEGSALQALLEPGIPSPESLGTDKKTAKGKTVVVETGNTGSGEPRAIALDIPAP